jgi:hypothetical protein
MFLSRASGMVWSKPVASCYIAAGSTLSRHFSLTEGSLTGPVDKIAGALK